MTLLYRYTSHPTRQPVWALGGRWERPRPVIAVTVLGAGGTCLVAGLLDTGADDTVFPETLAAKLGIDLTNAPVGEASGVGLKAAPVRYAEVTLRIATTQEFRQWPARVGFTPAPLKRPLLGFAGFLQFFSAYFHGDREEVELTVNSRYPGT